MPATSPAAKSQELKPLPTRVTKQQYAALVALRAKTGMSIQEHVRRALDYYLFNTQRPGATAAEAPQPRSTAASSTAASPASAAVASIQARPPAARVIRR